MQTKYTAHMIDASGYIIRDDEIPYIESLLKANDMQTIEDTISDEIDEIAIVRSGSLSYQRDGDDLKMPFAYMVNDKPFYRENLGDLEGPDILCIWNAAKELCEGTSIKNP